MEEPIVHHGMVEMVAPMLVVNSSAIQCSYYKHLFISHFLRPLCNFLL